MEHLLKEYFGFDEFRPLQKEIISSVLEGRDTLVLMPTGGGKSLCYQLPALALEGVTIVVSPLIALMKDQVDSLRTAGVPAGFINSTLNAGQLSQAEERVRRGEVKILYVAPERLATGRFRAFLSDLDVSLIAIDEAHCISEWGHEFRPDYRNLKSLRETFRNTPAIALTATATERVRDDIVAQLGFAEPAVFVSSFDRPNLTYRVIPKTEPVSQMLTLLSSHKGESAIVYCFSRRDTEEMASALKSAGVRAVPYHAGLDAGVRQRNQEAFVRDEVQVVAATVAFGMGIDKPDIRLVVHHDVPNSVERYYQETGRAGRDGLPAECVALFDRGVRGKHEFFIQQMENAVEREGAYAKLEQAMRFCRLNSCRRAHLLAYFGETYPEKRCGNCDVCIEGFDQFDATIIAQKILSAVVRTGERFGAAHVAGVLTGSNMAKARQLGHDKLSVFGIVRDHTRQQISDLCAMLVDEGLLEKTRDRYAVLTVTTAGRDFLHGKATLTLTRAKANAEPQSGTRRGSIREAMSGQYDTGLFEHLRQLRKSIADERGVPPFVVFSDASLVQMARLVPTSRDAFALISGVGASKLLLFADRFTRAIGEYAEANGIEIPAPPAPGFRSEAQSRTRTRPSNRQAASAGELAGMLSQGMSLEAIAARMGFVKSTVLNRLEEYVQSGSRFDFSHLVPTPDKYSKIRDAFINTGGSRLKPVRELLGEEYTYDEIRIVRLDLMQAGDGGLFTELRPQESP